MCFVPRRWLCCICVVDRLYHKTAFVSRCHLIPQNGVHVFPVAESNMCIFYEPYLISVVSHFAEGSSSL